MAGMTLKGTKCELLHEAMDILGFVATPHGLMLQKPKLEDLMEKSIPTTPKAAMTFLGAVAFLRRMVPRISLLTAPMTNAIKSFEKRHAPPKVKGALLPRYVGLGSLRMVPLTSRSRKTSTSHGMPSWITSTETRYWLHPTSRIRLPTSSFVRTLQTMQSAEC
jgi:hypothetical protein